MTCNTVDFVCVLQFGQSNTGPDSPSGNPWSGVHGAGGWMHGRQESLCSELRQSYTQLISGSSYNGVHFCVCLKLPSILITMCHVRLFRDSWLLCCIVSLMARYTFSFIWVITIIIFLEFKMFSVYSYSQSSATDLYNQLFTYPDQSTPQGPESSWVYVLPESGPWRLD